MAKRWWLLLGLAAVLSFFGWRSLGISAGYIIHGPSIAAGIGAKLLCSAEYVSGMSREQAFEDVRQYSPILDELSVTYDPERHAVTASFWGISEKTARYIEGLGCAITFSDADARHQIKTVATTQSDAPWPLGSRVDTIDPALQVQVADIVREDNARGLNTRALLVVHQGRVVAEAYDQGAGPGTPLLGWSMAKSLTAIMLGNLEFQGIADLSLPPGFSGWDRDARRTITTSHLLTMTDGLDFLETYEPGDNATIMLFDTPSASGYAMQVPASSKPGERYNYSSGTANLLARHYQDLLGSPQAAYDAFIHSIYEPLGMQNAVLEVDPSGTFVGSSYFYASARDWARMGQLMLNGGELMGRRIVSEDWVLRATTPNASINDKAYGYQWWLNSGNDELRFPLLPADAYFANGNRQQTVMVIPSEGAVIVRLGWTSGAYPIDINVRSILDLLAQRS